MGTSERLGQSSVRETADAYSHAIRGRDDEAARRWEEFQGGICRRNKPTFNKSGAALWPPDKISSSRADFPIPGVHVATTRGQTRPVVNERNRVYWPGGPTIERKWLGVTVWIVYRPGVEKAGFWSSGNDGQLIPPGEGATARRRPRLLASIGLPTASPRPHAPPLAGSHPAL